MATKGSASKVDKNNFTIPKAFKRATTDEQRVEIVYNNMGFNVAESLDTLGNFKSAEISTNSRLAGNSQFAGRTPLHMHFALLFYSKSIAFAPYPTSPGVGSQELSFGFANRSAALFGLGYYEVCLKDIERALEFGYPDSLKYKLLERRGRCESNLGRASDASKSLEAALGALSLAALPEKRRYALKSTITKRLAEGNASDGDRPKEVVTSVSPPKSYGENATIPCASDCVEITYTEEMGRQMTATRDIYPGDVLIVEPPFAAAFIMNTKEEGVEQANYTHCYTCMKRLPALVPCKYCPLAMFCSESCRQTSWDEYHRYECPIVVQLQDLSMDGNVFLLLRILLLACSRNSGPVGLYEAVTAMERNRGAIAGFNSAGKYDSHDYTAVHHLMRHTEKRSNTQLFVLAVHASVVTRTLDSFTDFFAQTTKRGGRRPPRGWKMFVGGLLLRNLQAMYTGSCGIADIVEGPGDKGALKIKFAHGLYPTSSMLNHSCNPNVLSHFRDGNVRGVMAVRPIKKGEQVFISGQSYVIAELPKRRAYLREHFFITCKCEACVNDWPTPTALDKAAALVAPTATWRCSRCLSVLPPLPRSCPAQYVHVCRHCSATHVDGRLKAELQDIAVQAHLVFTLVRDRTHGPRDLRGRLAEQLMRLERLVEPPHPLAVSIQEQMHQNFGLLGNYYRL